MCVLTMARAQADRAEQEAKSARARAAEAGQDAKARLVDEVASKVADWQKTRPHDSRNPPTRL